MARQMRNQTGFTMVEMLMAMAIAAIVLALVVPSFSAYNDKRRAEGAMGELVTDIQLARSEAVSRNEAVRVTFGADCYLVHLSSATTATCSSSTASVIPATAAIKTMQLTTAPAVTMTAANALTFIEFSSQLGNATWNGTNAAEATINVTDSAGRTPLRLRVQALGRSQVCSPGGENKGYTACP